MENKKDCRDDRHKPFGAFLFGFQGKLNTSYNMHSERKEKMKKIIMVLAIAIFGAVFTFGETKFYAGFGLCNDVHTNPDDITTALGFNHKPGFSAKAIADYKYVYSETLFSTRLNPPSPYFSIENHSYLKYNVFFLGASCDISFTTQYVDITLGVDYSVKPFDWLEIGCLASVGYVPLNTISIWNEGNQMVTKLQITIKAFNILTFYAGMESLEVPENPISYKIHSIKNTIGAKAEYFFGNIGVYASIDYYCKHPEVFSNMPTTVANSVKYAASIGVAVKI